MPQSTSIQALCAAGILAALMMSSLKLHAEESPQFTDDDFSFSQEPTTTEPTIPSEPWYQVELYIFKQPLNTDEEYWPIDDKDHTLPDNAILIKPALSQEAYAPFQQVPKNWIHSDAVRKRLQRSRQYDMLFQAAWRQTFAEADNADVVAIMGGALQENNKHELEGTVTLYRGRYLHVEAQLVYGRYARIASSSFDTNSQSIIEATEPPLRGFEMGTVQTELLPYGPEPAYQTLERYDLNQSRRMRSGELHYLDHPKLGILIQVHRLNPGTST